jgi:phosphocarrier protein HPr
VISRQVVVATPRGLGEEPAGRFSTAARGQPARVTVVMPDGRSADARSTLAVVELGIDGGQEVTLTADDGQHGAEVSLEALAALLASDLEAEDDT